MQRDISKLGGLAISAVLILAVFGAGIGAVSAGTYGDSGNVTLPVNDTFDVTDSTESLNVMAENITGDTGTAYVIGIDGDGNETEVTTLSLETNESGGTYTDKASFTNINATKYPEYKLRFNASGGTADSVELYLLDRVTGGGAGLLGGGVPTSELAAGVIVIAGLGAFSLYRRD